MKQHQKKKKETTLQKTATSTLNYQFFTATINKHATNQQQQKPKTVRFKQQQTTGDNVQLSKKRADETNG